MHMLPVGCYSLDLRPNLYPGEGKEAYAGKMPLQTIPPSEGDDRNFMLPRDVDNFDDIFGRCSSHVHGVG
jgi:hypothetical protein